MEILNYSDIDLAQTIKRSEEDVNKVLDIVSDILDNVKNNKDKAIREYTEKFDGVSIENLKVSEDEIKEAYDTLDDSLLVALKQAASNIEKFHKKQIPSEWEIEVNPGIVAGQIVRPINSAGCYIPGGRAAYPSSILMTVIPAKIAGVKKQFTIDDVKERIMSMLDQVIMKWIVREGKDLFNLQANAYEISKGIQEDLDMEMEKIGIAITNFTISSVSYPKEVQEMATKAASHSMIGDMNKYTQVAMADSLSKGNSGGSVAGDMASIQMGMMMGQQIINNMNNKPQNNENQQSQSTIKRANFCPNCGTKNEGSNFCPNCGTKLN